jgi:predicted Fe-Mo cluster-binding NifX family protein
VVLPRMSAEKLCLMILTKDVDTVICGGIEEEYYQYLIWKRITVYDSVIGSWQTAVELLLKDDLEPGAIVSRILEKHGHAG